MANTKTKLLIAAFAALAASHAAAQPTEGADGTAAEARTERTEQADGRTREAPPAERPARLEAAPTASEAQRKALADWQEFQALQQRLP